MIVGTDFEAARRLSAALRETELAVEHLGEAGVDYTAAGRPTWAADAARIHALADDLADRVRENRR